jgi:sRNA-binding carbon storage regulator CsrA
MLVLGRRLKEPVRLKVGDHVMWVQVLEDNGRGRYRLGFQADPEVKIMRDEVLPIKERYQRRNL